jgi:Zn-dependent protease with chaperone function
MTHSASDAELYSIAGRLEPTRPSWAYRAGMVVVAGAMLMLPLLYLSLIAVAGSLVWWHLTANQWLMEARSGGLLRLIAYAGPAVAGGILVFFMVKPVFARPARRIDPVEIQPDAEPELFRFVRRICEHVRAPVPSRIQVDCQVNASASFSSMLGLLRPRFVLTIGLPLAAGLSVRQLGGVLAHEFGHFAQGGGMRLTFIVRSINGWFARVVMERDQWDEKLERWAKDGDWRVSIVLLLAKAGVWASRRILYGLMIAGHAISCFMMRQMEYDADSYEIKFAGSAAFLATSARMRELNVGAQIGYHEVQEGWVRRTLPSDLPVFLVNQCGRIPEELSKQLRDIPDGETGWLDTHPADRDRARAAERAQATGILIDGDVPAARLFRSFQALGAAVTRHHYEHDLGLTLEATKLTETHAALAATVNRQKNEESARTFFGRHDGMRQERRLDVLESLTESELIERMLDARRAMAQGNEQDAGVWREYERFTDKLALALAANALFDAGFTQVSAADFELTEGTREGAAFSASFAEAELRRLEPILTRLDDPPAARFSCAIALLERTPLDFDHASSEALRHRARRLNAVHLALSDAWPHIQEVRRLLTTASLLAANVTQCPDPAAIDAQLTAVVDRIRSHLDKVRTAVGDTPAPDEDPDRPDRLAWLLRLDSPIDTEQMASQIIQAALSVSADVLGRLSAVALEVEAAVDRRGIERPVPSTESAPPAS